MLFELLGPVAGKALLDVGCGDGAFASELTQRGAAVTGVDPDPAMIAVARRQPGSENILLLLVEGRAEALPFPDAKFDQVLAVTTLCFIPDAERAVAEMARVLKPKGLLVIGELGRWSLWAAYRRMRGWLRHPLWRAARFRSCRELRHLVEVAGTSASSRYAAPYTIRHAGRWRDCLPLSIHGSDGEQLSGRLLSLYQQRSLSRKARRRARRPPHPFFVKHLVGTVSS